MRQARWKRFLSLLLVGTLLLGLPISATDAEVYYSDWTKVEVEPYEYSFAGVGDYTLLPYLLSLNGIFGFILDATVDSDAVELDDDLYLTATDYFDTVTLIIDTDVGEYTFLLHNPNSTPAPIPAGTEVTGENGSFTADGEIPEGTELTVTSYTPTEEQAAAVEGENVVWLDIGLVADGEQVEAGAAVTLNVNIPLPEAPEQDGKTGLTVLSDVRLFHFLEDGEIEELDAEAEVEEGVITSLSFTTSSFSPFAVAYTVDFTYEDEEGKAHNYSIPGRGVIALSDLVDVLSITEYETVEEFIEHVENVEFSDPSLIRVVKVEENTTLDHLFEEADSEKEIKAGDWALISLEAFDTGETLTITMDDGKEIVVAVTDAEIVHEGTWGSGNNTGTWSIDKNGVLTVTGTGNLGVAPWSDYKDEITGLVIGEGITNFNKDNLFENYTSLETISLPSTFQGTWNNTFKGCTALTSVDLSKTKLTTINSGTFTNCTSLQQVILPETVTTLGGFNGCSSLSDINFPAALTSISGFAFQGCTSLTDANLANTNVTAVNYNAFDGCTALRNVTFPDTLNTIGSQTFKDCPNITSVDLSKTSVTVLNASTFSGASSLQTVKLPTGITDIGGSAFNGCKELRDINLSNLTSLTTIGGSAFSGCALLQTLDLSATQLTAINYDAFRDCTGITSAKLPKTLETFGNWIFGGCTSLKELDFSGNTNLKSIGNNVINGCTSLEKLNLSGCTGLTTLAEGAFASGKGLKEVDLSNCTGLTELPKSTFNGCSQLETVNLEGCTSITTIGDSAFRDCDSITQVILNDLTALTTIEKNAFNSCDKLERVDLSGTQVTSIGDYAFYVNKVMETIILPDTLETVGAHAFHDCKVLKVDLSNCENLKEIQDCAFYHMTTNNSSSLSVNGAVSGLSGLKNLETIGEKAFESTTILDEELDFSNGALETIGKGAFQQGWNSGKNLTAFTKVDLSGTPLQKISSDAFKDLTKIVEVDLTGCTGAYTIESSAFEGCRSLGTVTFGSDSGVTKIEKGAFKNCYGLDLIDLDECHNLTSIGDNAFENTAIETLTIPESVTSIGTSTFAGCKDIVVLEWNAKNYDKAIAAGTFPFVRSGETATSTQNTNRFDLRIGSQVESLPENFFYFLNNAGDIYFDGGASGHPITINMSDTDKDNAPEPLRYIEKGNCFVDSQGVLYELFDDNTARIVYCPPEISSYTVPEYVNGDYKVTEVGKSAFVLAKDLESITFAAPDNITSIADRAFYGLNTLKTVNGERTVPGAKNSFGEGTDIAESAFQFTGLIDTPETRAPEKKQTVQKYTFSTTTADPTTVTVKIGESSFDRLGIDPVTGEASDAAEDYHFLTGDALNITVEANTNNSQKGATVRIYLEFTQPDYDVGSLDLKPTTDENIYYYDLDVTTGTTAVTAINWMYPSPTSDGGGVKIWAEIYDGKLTDDEKAVTPMAGSATIGTGENGENIEILRAPTAVSAEYVSADWTTSRRERKLSKSGTPQIVSILGNAEQNNKALYPLAVSAWDITMAYNDNGRENSTNGSDYVRSATFTDTLTLPQGIRWDPEIVEALRAGSSLTLTTRTSKADSRIQKDIYLGSRKVLYLNFPDTDTLTDVSLSLDSSDNIIISWTLKEMTQQKELSNLPVKLGVFEGTLVMDLYQTYISSETTGDYKITLNNTDGNRATEDDFPLRFVENIANAVAVDMYYTHTTAVHLQDSDAISAEASRANLTFDKVRNSAEYTKLGDSNLSYTLTVENSGTQATYGLEYIEDSFSGSANGTVGYFSPANMERMFQETEKLGVSLTFTIENATLFDWTSGGESDPKTVTGGDATLDKYNSGTREQKGTGTITITKTAEGYQVVFDDGSGRQTVTGTSIATLLESLGYYVTAGADYHARWDFSNRGFLTGETEGDLYRFDGGQKLELPVYASNKTTFELLPEDQPSSYGGPIDLNVRQTNKGTMQVWEKEASGTTYAEKPAITDTATYYASKEVSIAKKGSTVGTVVDTNRVQYMRTPVMEYTATASNTGNINFGTLPVTDTLTGSQALLAPVDQQENKTQFSNCPVITVLRDGVETQYYVLTEGTYTNVYLGEIRLNGSKTGANCLADSITVTKTETPIGSSDPEYMDGVEGNKINFTSNIRWNLDSLPSNSSRAIVYDAVGIAFTSEDTALRIFTYDNIVYLNGLNDDRLYDRISESGGLGSSYSMDKAIVETLGSGYDLSDTSKNDHTGEVLDDDDYSRITARDNTVLYKLTLSYNPPQEGMSIAFKGSEIYDALPMTYGTFSWVKGTKGTVGAEGNVALEVATEGTVSLSENFATDWTVTNDANQTIRWPDNATIQLTGKSELTIYVTLTYANSTERGADGSNWEKYCKAAKGDTLVNTFYVCNKPSSVTHDLVYGNEAYLQKGVSYVYDLADTGDRQHYSNGEYAYVEYYTVIYNGGYSKLYLADLIDDMPRGFTFHSVNSGMNAYANSNGAKYTSATSSYSRDGNGVPAIVTDPSLGEGETLVYKAANISASVNAAGQLVFHFTGNKNSANFISFDEVVAEEQGEDNAWYLNRGEAIAFTYTMKVDKTYGNTDDFARNQIHMNFNDPFGAGISRYEFTEGGGATSARGGVQANDGSCYDYDGNRGLMSWVELERGEIIPGIQKNVVSYTTGNNTRPISSGNTAENPSSVMWEVTEKNQGSQEINAYVLTDTVDLPFQPMGKVSYTVYDSKNKERAAAYSNTSTAAPYLFEITHISDTAVTVLDLKGREHTINYTIVNSEGRTTQTGNNETITLPYVKYTYGNSGTEFKQDETFALSFTKVYSDATNKHGTVSMNLRFAEGVMSIIPAGYGTLRVSTSPIGSYDSGRYVNRADFNPDRDYTQAGDGLNMVDYVRDSANITVNNSGSTSSIKRVMENQHTTNIGNSDPQQNETNTITLADASNDFTYTLEVTNTTGQEMSKLVLVDNLPEVGDHYTLQPGTARQSAFKVVLDGNGSFAVEIGGVKTEDFTVQYSAKTVFTEADLQGEASSGWTENPANARSIRVIINAPVGDKATAKVTFKAKVDGERETESSDGVYLLTDAAWIKAHQGDTAYNSFAYWYRVPSFDLSAGTELVGVQLPAFPNLTKQVLNRADEVVTNSTEMFDFVIYEGNYQDSLPTNATDFEAITTGTPRMVTVGEGTEATKYLQVRISAGTASNDLYRHEFWENGKTYTIQEVEKDGYTQLNWNGRNVQATDSGTGYYTFVYNNNSTQEFTARNREQEWSLEITKVDASDNSIMKGIRFALYSRRPEDAVADTQGAPATYVDTNNVTWYCCAVQSTDNSGKITFDHLSESLYRYLEVDTPRGFKKLTPQYQTVSPVMEGTVNTEVKLTVKNPYIEPVKLSIPIQKTLTGRDMRAGEFKFILEPVDIEGRNNGKSVTITNPAAKKGETAEFKFDLTYSHKDYNSPPYRDTAGNAVFFYRLYEEQGSAGGVTYDKSQYIVKVTMTEANEKFTCGAEYFVYGGNGPLPDEATRNLVTPATTYLARNNNTGGHR